jgi:WD40 repeat protein
MKNDRADAAIQFDVFISYKHEDKEFAAKLQKTLSRYKPPAGIDAPRRTFKVFLDESDMAGVEYFDAVDKALRGSAKLIVICSPEARNSDYINDEIQRFVKYKDAKSIIPVIIRGIPNNEATEDNQDKRAFPSALCDALKMPLAVDYRDYNRKTDKLNSGKYKNEWYKLLTDILNAKRVDIEQREQKRLRQRLIVAILLASVVIISLSVLAAVAWIQKREAQHQRDIAISQLMVIDGIESLKTQPDRSLLLAVAAARINPSSNSRDLLMKSVLNKDRLERYLTTGSQPWIAAAVSKDAGYILSATVDSQIELHKTNGQKPTHKTIANIPGVTTVAIAPNNAIAAIGTTDGDVQIWGLESARLIKTLKGKSIQRISGLAFSLDSRRLIVGAAYTNTFLWDVEEGIQLAQLDQHISGPQAFAFQRNNRLLATGAENGRVVLWNFEDELSYFVLEDPNNSHSGFIYALAFSPDGKSLVSAGTDRKVLMWDLESRKVRKVVFNKGKGDTTKAIRFDSEGKRLAIASESGTIMILGLDLYSQKITLDASPIEPTDIAFSRDGIKVVVAGVGNYAMVFKISDTERFAKAIVTNGGNIGPMIFSQDGNMIATLDCAKYDPDWLSCIGREINIWDTKNLNKVCPPIDLKTAPRALYFTKNGSQLIIVDNNKHVTIRDIKTDRVSAVFKPPEPEPVPNRIQGNQILRGSLYQRAVFEEPFLARVIPAMGAVPEMEVPGECTLYNTRIGPLAFRADGEMFVYAGSGCIFVWKMTSGWSTEPVMRNVKGIRALSLSADGERLAIVKDDGSSIVRSLKRNGLQYYQQISVKGITINRVAFSPDGERLAIVKNDGSFIVRSLKPDGPQYYQQISVKGITINRVAFSPDGTLLAIAGKGQIPSDEEGFLKRFDESGFLSVWDVSKEPVVYAQSSAYPTPISSMAFSRDGKTIAVGYCNKPGSWFCPGGVISLWDVSSKKHLGLSLPAHHDDVYNLVFSPRSNLLFSRSSRKSSVSGDDRILVWDLSVSHWIKMACLIANRNFNSDERDQFFVDIYGQPCENLH